MSEDTRRYAETCFGDAEGWLCVAVGLKPYRDANGKYKHHKWDEVAFRWPQQSDEALTYITKAGPLGDVYMCPYPMKEPRRAKGNAGQRVLIHADVDHELDPDEGGPARRVHRALRLHPATATSTSRWRGRSPRPARSACVVAWPHTLGGDTKYSDNDLLRPPGTLNYKSKVDGGDPEPGDRAVVRQRQGRSADASTAARRGFCEPDRHQRPPRGMPTPNVRAPPWISTSYPSVRQALERRTRRPLRRHLPDRGRLP